MHFIIALLENENYLNIIIITDRLSKDVSLTALLNLEIEMIIQSFIKNHIASATEISSFFLLHSYKLNII